MKIKKNDEVLTTLEKILEMIKFADEEPKDPCWEEGGIEAEKLIELLTAQDEDSMEYYLQNGDITFDLMLKCIKNLKDFTEEDD